MHLILTGATGTVGSAVLKHCLADPAVTRLSIISRRPVAQANGQAKASTIILNDFTSYPPEVLSQLKGANGCVWALGISQSQVTKDEYIKITYDYTMAAANAFASLSPSFNFVYVSGEGADQAEKARALFGNIKGRAEKNLLALPQQSPTLSSLKIYNVRPAAVDPQGEILKDTPSSAVERYGGMVLLPILRTFVKSLVIDTKSLAKVLTRIAVGDGEPIPAGKGVEYDGRLLRNVAVRRMAGLDDPA